MEATNELQLLLFNEIGSIREIEITYEDGTIVPGFVSQVFPQPFQVIVTKKIVPRGKSSYHRLDFSNAKSIKVGFHNGISKTFP
ncbi:MAG: hypothetical protein H6581_31105 [Bacteroidia bacterium]|nr:hypothetical protein [Bacteroidia bacterium]MCB9236138.1 hypothetical protein [Bacteroidia bacterium]